MVTVEDIRAAASRIAPAVHKTPVLTSRLFNAETGVEAFFKCENLQRAGAFKIRGAANFLHSLAQDQLKRGVVAFSSGNHAQAVALAAGELGVNATIVMPSDAPAVKLAATRAYGARVIEYNRHTEDREAIGRKAAEETGAALVPPFDHEWIVAGQGTCAFELMGQIESLDALVVCIGGGGLIAGSAIAAKALRPEIRVWGVEPQLANDTFLSFRARRRVGIPPPETIADGLRSPMPGAVTFPIVQRLVDDIVLVTEQEIVEAQKYLASRLKIVVEPSGAVSAAAVLFRRIPDLNGRVGIILSGGNC